MDAEQCALKLLALPDMHTHTHTLVRLWET